MKIVCVFLLGWFIFLIGQLHIFHNNKKTENPLNEYDKNATKDAEGKLGVYLLHVV